MLYISPLCSLTEELSVWKSFVKWFESNSLRFANTYCFLRFGIRYENKDKSKIIKHSLKFFKISKEQVNFPIRLKKKNNLEVFIASYRFEYIYTETFVLHLILPILLKILPSPENYTLISQIIVGQVIKVY